KRWMDGVRQQCAQNDPIAALRSMVMDIDYENWLRHYSSRVDGNNLFVVIGP
ncbi:ATP-dependent DNA helicase Rep, partial [Pseudomonas syringae pv. japonica str. M301072]